MKRTLICLLLLLPTTAMAQIRKFDPPQLTGDIIADIKAMRGTLPDIQSKLDAIKSSLPIKTPQQVNTDIETAVTAIENVTVKDLQDGIAVFDAAKNYAGSNCFKALLDVVQANVTANASIATSDAAAPPPDNQAVADKANALPVQHAFLVIAKLYNIVVANHPGGPLSMQCAAMKQDINSTGPMSALLGSSVFSKALPILKIIGIAG